MDNLQVKKHSHYFFDAECAICVWKDEQEKQHAAELPVRTAEKPVFDVRQAGQLPGVCEDCNRPPVEFAVFANQHFSFVKFYCHEHYLAATNRALHKPVDKP